MGPAAPVPAAWAVPVSEPAASACLPTVWPHWPVQSPVVYRMSAMVAPVEPLAGVQAE